MTYEILKKIEKENHTKKVCKQSLKVK